MPADSDADIIRAAYAERVREAFMAFAENLSAGQAEKACKDRFLRALELAQKARDLALEVTSAEFDRATLSDDNEAGGAMETAEPLSAEAQAIIDNVLAGTTGAPRVVPPPTRFGKTS